MAKLGGDPFESDADGLKPPGLENAEQTRRRSQWMQHISEGSFRDPELHRKMAP